MAETLLLLSKRSEDALFMKGVAASTGYPLVVANDFADAIEKAESIDQPLLFAEASRDEDFRQLCDTLEPLVKKNPAKFATNSLHLFTSENWKSLFECAKTSFIGHLIFHSEGDPEIPGREYGRIILAAKSQALFGLKNYLAPNARIERLAIHNTQEKESIFGQISNFLNEETVPSRRIVEFLIGATDELLMNAIYDAPAAASGSKDNVERATHFELKGKRAVELEIGFDEDYVALTVVDHFGSLDRSKLLTHLLKTYRSDQYEIDPTVAGAGLGLAITLKTGGSLLFATEPGSRTEVTVLMRKMQNWRAARSQYRFVSVHVANRQS